MADETGFLHDAVLDTRINGKLIAAQRIVAVRAMAGIRHCMKIARMTVVVEDYFLV
jgi:hypothetical protein